MDKNKYLPTDSLIKHLEQLSHEIDSRQISIESTESTESTESRDQELNENNIPHNIKSSQYETRK